MALGGGPAAASKGLPPGGSPWATPGRLLALFCVMCLFIYLDRGMIASNGVNGASATAERPASGIQGDFRLSLFQDGLLPAAFMVGLLVSSPIFAEASKHHNAFRLIGLGLAVWTVAAAGCGLAPGFGVLLVCRMAVGVGEASFVALAAPFIDDNAPPARKALWLGVFFGCIPTGYALGYIFGGLVGGALGWRAAFLIEAAAMVPFVVFCLRAPPINLRGSSSSGSSSGSAAGSSGSGSGGHEGSNRGGSRPAALLARLRLGARTIASDVALLLRHPVYVWTVAGMTVYTAVLGAFAFYGPKAGRDVFAIAPERADITFGAITVLTGTLGTLAGGSLLDAIGSSMRNALLLCAVGIGAGSCLAVAAFWAAGSFALFSLVFAAAQLAMFASAAPSNAVCMWGVPPALRPFAVSMSVVAIHVFGDVPSPPLLGALQGWLQNWRLSMSIASSLLLLGAAAYSVAALVSVTAIDYRELVAASEAGEGGGCVGGAGGSSAGLLAAARAAMAAEDGAEPGVQLSNEEGEEGGLGLGSSRPTSPDRPLLGPGARS
ncbi:putative sphingolipid transporter spinster-like protein 2 [Chlorella sorokiniana]|uniref:Sphingolipid transporter spinster-like protein 2 n=1 Tax=Chlorella sorokiniana TaxID=3076 RepID=A0A2P6TFM4_CHLSO|nr:putative sphingolipid transporter spinster-like protein 2 [Chlorella sorokiniana]|eukprot:PRW32913.1 putative sphingolipid transporter spinster-like protein 2 [Chlorella sorokiniana]